LCWFLGEQGLGARGLRDDIDWGGAEDFADEDEHRVGGVGVSSKESVVGKVVFPAAKKRTESRAMPGLPSMTEISS